MYPNPQDVLPLPPHPSIARYRRLAKELSEACRSDGADAYRAWSHRFVRRLYELQRVTRTDREIERQVGLLEQFARERLQRADCALTQAQFVIARAHGFASWTRFVEHVDRLIAGTGTFEMAADAIVAGDAALLNRLLRAQPALVRERSARAHAATLLHYVSANGVENYRQKTPQNIVAIARMLLDAGAEVDAEADVYGGGARTLGLVVTSAHPRAAGVQLELAELLIVRGARIETGMVRGCLANGCPEAAVFMAERLPELDLEEAAGVGRTDVVGELVDGSPQELRTDALLMACWYGRQEVVELLLDRGVEPGARAADDGRTALHIASYVGNAALVDLLLERGAAVDAVDETYRTPPLVWALHAWLIEQRAPADYRDVLLRLARAGAAVKREWIDDERVRTDAALHAILEARIAE